MYKLGRYVLTLFTSLALAPTFLLLAPFGDIHYESKLRELKKELVKDNCNRPDVGRTVNLFCSDKYYPWSSNVFIYSMQDYLRSNSSVDHMRAAVEWELMRVQPIHYLYREHTLGFCGMTSMVLSANFLSNRFASTHLPRNIKMSQNQLYSVYADKPFWWKSAFRLSYLTTKAKTSFSAVLPVLFFVNVLGFGYTAHWFVAAKKMED